MRKAIAILLGVALLSGADAVFARGGRGGGGHAGGAAFHGGGTSMGFHGGRGSASDTAGQEGADRFHQRRGCSQPVRICRTARASGGRAGVLSDAGCNEV